MQNRIEHTLNNLATYEENLTASESRIRDVDMASEMVNFTKLQILQQAGTAMLAQANQRPAVGALAPARLANDHPSRRCPAAPVRGGRAGGEPWGPVGLHREARAPATPPWTLA